MKVSISLTNELQQLLKCELGLNYKDGELSRAGLAIMRFVLSKELRSASINNQEKSNENLLNGRTHGARVPK